MAITEFALPDLGEGLTESQLVAWRVAPGETVELNQTIAEVETAKALVELPSPYAGVIAELYAQPGDTVQVGERLLGFTLEADAHSTDASDAQAAAEEPGESASAADVGAAAEEEPVAAPAPAASSPVSGAPGQEADGGIGETGDDGRTTEPRRTPTLVGYGAAASTGARPKRRPRKLPDASVAAASPPRRPVRGTWRTPIAGVRKHTAEAMVHSAFTAPHATTFLTVDVTRTEELLARLRERELEGRHVTILTAVAKAVCLAVPRTPEVNTRWDADAGEIVHFEAINLGIAAATPRGLMVPNIKDAGTLSLAQLAEALTELVQVAKEGRCGPEQLSGGTISVTNVGVFGVDAGTPILNPGEAAILALGAVRRQPWEHEGGIALRRVMTLALSFDHRLVDGEQGSRFLADIGRILTDPGNLLAMT